LSQQNVNVRRLEEKKKGTAFPTSKGRKNEGVRESGGEVKAVGIRKGWNQRGTVGRRETGRAFPLWSLGGEVGAETVEDREEGWKLRRGKPSVNPGDRP